MVILQHNLLLSNHFYFMFMCHIIFVVRRFYMGRGYKIFMSGIKRLVMSDLVLEYPCDSFLFNNNTI